MCKLSSINMFNLIVFKIHYLTDRTPQYEYLEEKYVSSPMILPRYNTLNIKYSEVIYTGKK